MCHTDHGFLTTVSKVHRRTLERFREILANCDFTLEYTKGEDMPSDFLSRHVKVESVEVKVDPNICGKKKGDRDQR